MARLLHLLTAYWCFVLLSLHLGTNLTPIVNAIKLNDMYKEIIRFAGILLACYGVFAFVRQNIISYLFLQQGFVFFNINQSLSGCLIDYIAIMSFGTMVGYSIKRLFIKINLCKMSKENENKKRCRLMKKWIILVFLSCLIFSLTACSAQVNEADIATKDNIKVEEDVSNLKDENKKDDVKVDKRFKVVSEQGDTIVFVLNDSQAAQDLYNQLPINIKIENFSNNEKIFYPSGSLDVKNTPHPSNVDMGTLAYYRPWGNVVMFYDKANPNNDLYELGYAVSGKDLIKNLSGNITVEKLEEIK